MSELKTNKISTNDQNNVAIDNALGLKSYDTTGMNALTSVAGDMIYNTTENKVFFYNGSAWGQTGSALPLIVSYLIIAGGGGGAGSYGGGGGAGGYRNSYASETSGRNSATEIKLATIVATNYTVEVGAGGAGSSNNNGANGSDSSFASVLSNGGGNGADTNRGGGSGGSGGGAGGNSGSNPGNGKLGQGFDGGPRDSSSYSGGGGGAGAVGIARQPGDGLSSSITGTAVTRASGGPGTGGSYKAGNQADNTGGGGGQGTNGRSGVVILRYSKDYTITLAGGATSTAGEQTDGDDKYIEIKTTGTVSWA